MMGVNSHPREKQRHCSLQSCALSHWVKKGDAIRNSVGSYCCCVDHNFWDEKKSPSDSGCPQKCCSHHRQTHYLSHFPALGFGNWKGWSCCSFWMRRGVHESSERTKKERYSSVDTCWLWRENRKDSHCNKCKWHERDFSSEVMKENNAWQGRWWS